jgi:hypothetical protein
LNRALHNHNIRNAGNKAAEKTGYSQNPDLQKQEFESGMKQSGAKPSAIGATDEQKKYANMLSVGRKVGLISILVALGVYVFGVVPPKVPVELLPQYWGLSSKEFMNSAGLQPGWSWVGLYKYGDIMSYFGVAILGAVSAICYAAIIPGLLRKKDYAFVLIAVAEVLVLALAASGIVNIGE